jgi:hypothetical protein
MSYSAGTLTFPSGLPAIAATCRAQGCTNKIIQPQTVSSGVGYTQQQVSSGPNQGGWYVTSTSLNIQLASAMNPEYGPGGAQRSTTQCWGYTLINFWDFNRVAGPGCGNTSGFGTLWNGYVFDHEELHVENIESYIENWPYYDVRRKLEGIVRLTSTVLKSAAQDAVTLANDCVKKVGGAHTANSVAVGNPQHQPASFNVWYWDLQTSQFFLRAGGTGSWTDTESLSGCTEAS